VIVTYIWPLAVSVSIDQQYDKWYMGYYSQIAYEMGGQGFKIFMTVVGLVSALGLFNARLCASSWSLAVFLRDIGFPIFGKVHSKFKTPWLAIIINSAVIAVFSILPFQILVMIDVVLYSLSLVLQFAALFQLRVTEPNMDRPYRVPVQKVGMLVFIAPPVALCLFSIIWPTIFSQDIVTPIVNGVALALGIILYFIWKFFYGERVRNYEEYEDNFSLKGDAL